MNTAKINISNLSDGEHRFEFKLEAEDLEIETVEIVSDIDVNADLYKSGNQFDLNVNVRGKFKLQCDRCMEDYIQDFNKSFEIFYKYEFTNEEVLNDDNDEIKFISPKINSINIAEDVRDYILLSIPMKHAPVEHNGICTYCNRDIAKLLNVESKKEISPVWEKLIQAKTK